MFLFLLFQVEEKFASAKTHFTTSTLTSITTTEKALITPTTSHVPCYSPMVAYLNECEAQGKFFCLCENNQTLFHHKATKDICDSIGCVLAGNYCLCGKEGHCICRDLNLCHYQCNQYPDFYTKGYYKGCYCYFGDKVITTEYVPKSGNCADLLKEIGDRNGRYQCSRYACGCDQNTDCVCNPPTYKYHSDLKKKQCDSCKCQKRSFEYCQCTHTNCS